MQFIPFECGTERRPQLFGLSSSDGGSRDQMVRKQGDETEGRERSLCLSPFTSGAATARQRFKPAVQSQRRRLSCAWIHFSATETLRGLLDSSTSRVARTRNTTIRGEKMQVFKKKKKTRQVNCALQKKKKNLAGNYKKEMFLFRHPGEDRSAEASLVSRPGITRRSS